MISIGDYAFWCCPSLTSVVIGNSVASIGNWTFNNCPNLTDAYYKGSEQAWAKIEIGSDNDELIDSNIHYNYVPEG